MVKDVDICEFIFVTQGETMMMIFGISLGLFATKKAFVWINDSDRNSLLLMIDG